ncbi:MULTISPECIES: GrpB family protein [Amycolatopsis]|uniref:Dephospho-CoA kinase n=2 Tax=Amycolatopsis TaxID=1813 RepID=A0A1I3U767_9PSEU|nr:GrpB family protein [Amycolatopsis sacchari]SFJ77637.1 dephospho-CoA kinase [Amycolatopsis sacchari]
MRWFRRDRPRRSRVHGVPFAAPSADWPRLFAAEAARLTQAGVPGELQHIGSTAVPGLAAKPIIDIQLVIPDGQWNPGPLLDAGYRHIHGFTSESRYYELYTGRITYLIRRRDPSDPNVRRCLLLRDYLLAHPDEAAAYGELKAGLARRSRHRPGRYREGKAPWLVAANARAEEWARETGWPG